MIESFLFLVTPLVLILTFLNTHRPYLGVVETKPEYEHETMELVVWLTYKNTGNAPAINVRSRRSVKRNGQPEEICEERAENHFILPGQESTGVLRIPDVTETEISNDSFRIDVDLEYEQPFTVFGIHLPRPKFTTSQSAEYDYENRKFLVINGTAT